jgi:hypothetical protein
MTKRRALSLLAFFGYCFISSNTIAMDIEETNPVKNSTNSNSIDTKSDSSRQGKSHPLTEHYDKWIKNLEDCENDIDVSWDEEQLGDAFASAFDPSLYRDPIIVDGLTFYIPHGMTPTKTPRRKDNSELLSNGRPGVFVDPVTDMIVRKELHHVQQKPVDADIVLVTRDFHKKNHKKLHPFNISIIDRNKWAKTKRVYYISLDCQMKAATSVKAPNCLKVAKTLSFEDTAQKNSKRETAVKLKEPAKKKPRTKK